MEHTEDDPIVHCYQDTSETSQKRATQTISCCELFSSNQYFQAKLECISIIKYMQHNDIYVHPIHTLYILQKFPKFSVAFSP